MRPILLLLLLSCSGCDQYPEMCGRVIQIGTCVGSTCAVRVRIDEQTLAGFTVGPALPDSVVCVSSRSTSYYPRRHYWILQP